MASAGAHCYHLNHVFTQIPYALTVAGVSFVSFILAGLIQNVFVNLLIAVVLMVGTLLVIRAIVAKKHAGIFPGNGRGRQGSCQVSYTPPNKKKALRWGLSFLRILCRYIAINADNIG